MKRSISRRLGTVALAVATIGCGAGQAVDEPADTPSTTTIASTTSSSVGASSTTVSPSSTTTTAAPDIEIERLIQLLFRGSPPDHMVFQQEPDLIQVWEAGDITVVGDWPAWIVDVENEVAALGSGELVDLLDGKPLDEDVECPTLMSRSAVVLVLDQCVSGSWSYAEVRSGEPVDPPIEYEELLDGEWVWFAERGGTSLHGQGDAEGNLHTIESEAGQDLIAGDYASLPRLSPDGSAVAYVDHDDPAAISHFVSPVVVVRDVATGEELGRWVLDEPVTCLELSAEWLVACLGDPLDYPDGLQNQLAAINLATGDVTTVTTETHLFLPA